MYVINDLVDLDDDRCHPTKKHRPFAAGTLSFSSGVVAVTVLLISAFYCAATLLPLGFTFVMGGYFCVTLSYSLWLKRILIADVVVLGGLYTLRLIAGAFALGVSVSFWLLAFSMFVFFSLALVKRYAELKRALTAGKNGYALGRGYATQDLPILAALGAASGSLAVLVLALYVNDPATMVMYRRHEIIWLSCPVVLAAVSRIWVLAHRGVVDEDPVVFAIRDKASVGFALLILLIFVGAL